MTVDVASAVYRSTFEDTTYYFCSASCLTRFEEDPARFAAAVRGVPEMRDTRRVDAMADRRRETDRWMSATTDGRTLSDEDDPDRVTGCRARPRRSSRKKDDTDSQDSDGRDGDAKDQRTATPRISNDADGTDKHDSDTKDSKRTRTGPDAPS